MPQEHRKSPTLPPEPKRENRVSLDPPRGGVKVWGAQRKGLQRWRPEAVITVTLSLIIFFIKKLHYHGLSCKRSHNKGLWADGLLETWFWGGGEKDRGHGQGTQERRYKREIDQPQPWIMSALLPWSLVRSLKKCVRCSAWRKASHRRKTEATEASSLSVCGAPWAVCVWVLGRHSNLTEVCDKNLCPETRNTTHRA